MGRDWREMGEHVMKRAGWCSEQRWEPFQKPSR